MNAYLGKLSRYPAESEFLLPRNAYLRHWETESLNWPTGTPGRLLRLTYVPAARPPSSFFQFNDQGVSLEGTNTSFLNFDDSHVANLNAPFYTKSSASSSRCAAASGRPGAGSSIALGAGISGGLGIASSAANTAIAMWAIKNPESPGARMLLDSYAGQEDFRRGIMTGYKSNGEPLTFWESVIYSMAVSHDGGSMMGSW